MGFGNRELSGSKLTFVRGFVRVLQAAPVGMLLALLTLPVQWVVCAPSVGQELAAAPRSAPSADTLEKGASRAEPGVLAMRSSATGQTDPKNISGDYVIDSSYSRSFIVGVGTGAILLVVGMGFGIWLARKDQVSTGVPQTEATLKLFMDMFQLTKGFAGDVSQFRQFVDGVMKISAASGKNGPQHAAETARLLAQISKENEHLQERLTHAELTLKTQADSLVDFLAEARTDGLTRLPNRRAFDDEIKKRLLEWRRYNKPVSVLLIDVDNFKSFNDRYGHLAGDAVLASVGQAIQQSMRETDLVARFGGEEFAVVLVNAGQKEAALAAERARLAIEKGNYQYEGKTLHVTASCGVAQAASGEAMAELLKRADTALYASKDAGRNAAHWNDGQYCWRIQGDKLLAATSAKQSRDEAPSEPVSPRLKLVCNALSQRLDELLKE